MYFNPGTIVVIMIIAVILVFHYLTKPVLKYTETEEHKQWVKKQEQAELEYDENEKKAKISAFEVWIKEQEAIGKIRMYLSAVNVDERIKFKQSAKVAWNKWQRAKEKHTEKYDSYGGLGC